MTTARPRTGKPPTAADRRPPTGVRTAARRDIRAGGWTALVRRDFRAEPLARAAVLLDLAFAAVNLAVFLLISRFLSAPGRAAVEPSHDYFGYVAVGLSFMLVIQATTTQLTARVTAEQRAGTLEMLATQPLSPAALATGVAGYPFLLAAGRATIYLTVLGPLLGLRVGHADWPGVAVLLLVGCAAMAGVGILLMAVTVVVRPGDAAARVTVVALTFLSGTYFPVDALPAALRPLALALPSRLALDGLRAALAGASWTGPALALLGVAAVGLPLSTWTFGRALALATRRGILTRD
ncbi:ABC transporter permease [Micromonospora sp. WMMD882]|uniref:ABC transporter permease n=1 Tax=Micromonospora sp. WMMD882 TaxID=3015151 RepID=UPI00248B6532|nr:ABC transporter permease [Micromonospora sp. WMMD882]WBB82081.1 ABC transporter permease [Micromonospora sp. WMMD882]